MTDADIRRTTQAATKCFDDLGCPAGDIEDMVQDVLLKTLEFRAEGKLLNVGLECRNIQRRMYGADETEEKPKSPRRIFWEACREGQDPQGVRNRLEMDPAEIVEFEEECALFFARLTSYQCKVLRMRLEGWFEWEIGKELGCSQQAVLDTIQRIQELWFEKRKRSEKYELKR